MFLLLIPSLWAKPCVWEAEALDWRWSDELAIVSPEGQALVSLYHTTFEHVRVEMGRAGAPTLEIGQGPYTLRGPSGEFYALHPTDWVDLGGGLSVGPLASVGLSGARRGQATMRPHAPEGARAYVPDALPNARLSCDALSLLRPAQPDGDWALGEVQLVKGREVVVYDSPGGARLGAYPAADSDNFALNLWQESRDDLVVIERRDGFTHIVDDRLSWRLEAWVRDEDLEPLGEDLGLGGLGTRGRGSGGGTRCVAPGPLYVVNPEGRAWPIGEIGASDKAYTPVGPAAPGLSRIAIIGVSGIYPGPPGVSDWSFAVPSELLQDCPG